MLDIAALPLRDEVPSVPSPTRSHVPAWVTVIASVVTLGLVGAIWFTPISQFFESAEQGSIAANLTAVNQDSRTTVDPPLVAAPVEKRPDTVTVRGMSVAQNIAVTVGNAIAITPSFSSQPSSIPIDPTSLTVLAPANPDPALGYLSDRTGTLNIFSGATKVASVVTRLGQIEATVLQGKPGQQYRISAQVLDATHVQAAVEILLTVK